MAFDKAIEVGSVEKNARGEFFKVFKNEEKSGGNSVDVRVYYTKGDGELAPTKKGIYLSSELAPEVMVLMFEAMDASAKEDFISKIRDYIDDEAEEAEEVED